MPISEFKNDYRIHSADFVISKWIIEKIPHIFNGDYDSFIKTKLLIGHLLDVDSCSVVFVGSCSTGFSLNPRKHFKLYNKKSDIDIAIVSNYHFNIAWHCIRNIDITQLLPDAVISINDHRQRLVFWGTIATDRILGLLPFGEQWLKAIEILRENPIFENRDINFRLYQDHDSLRAYHRDNLRKNIANIINVQPQSITLQ